MVPVSGQKLPQRPLRMSFLKSMTTYLLYLHICGILLVLAAPPMNLGVSASSVYITHILFTSKILVLYIGGQSFSIELNCLRMTKFEVQYLIIVPFKYI